MSRIIKKRLSTKSSTLLIRELKKLRVASPKSKVQQRINTKKKLILWLWKSKIVLNFEPLSIGGSIVATLSQQDIGGAFSLVYAFETILDPFADPQCRFD